MEIDEKNVLELHGINHWSQSCKDINDLVYNYIQDVTELHVEVPYFSDNCVHFTISMPYLIQKDRMLQLSFYMEVFSNDKQLLADIKMGKVKRLEDIPPESGYSFNTKVRFTLDYQNSSLFSGDELKRLNGSTKRGKIGTKIIKNFIPLDEESEIAFRNILDKGTLTTVYVPQSPIIRGLKNVVRYTFDDTSNTHLAYQAYHRKLISPLIKFIGGFQIGIASTLHSSKDILFSKKKMIVPSFELQPHDSSYSYNIFMIDIETIKQPERYNDILLQLKILWLKKQKSMPENKFFHLKEYKCANLDLINKISNQHVIQEAHQTYFDYTLDLIRGLLCTGYN
jgi:hypothetical protein